jgi:hypothetical protein
VLGRWVSAQDMVFILVTDFMLCCGIDFEQVWTELCQLVTIINNNEEIPTCCFTGWKAEITPKLCAMSLLGFCSQSCH